jgi:hypothetical protein
LVKNIFVQLIVFKKMKSLIITLLFGLIASGASAQYGQLEPLRESDTLNYVLRTAKSVTDKMAASSDKAVKKTGKLIQSVEKQLELARGSFLAGRITTINTTSFTNNIKLLESLGVDTSYYVQEFFIYYPRSYQQRVQPSF